ncbi:uncharacterized protein An08g06010 [Aspergillus niger]|uniref:Contig An08c0130, genomic contig n=2 Tax=Aspergillus niger TaxID=5061 RepID=A2QRH0_ASPNC|nr:uncharacterized protein An08g06010 [Aspergillus niger]CAK45571.1 unnamed protein product [Aspergillus niger]
MAASLRSLSLTAQHGIGRSLVDFPVTPGSGYSPATSQPDW